MKRIYVAGAGGMLGEAIHKIFSDHELHCSDLAKTESWLEKLDFRDSEEYFRQVLDFKPDVLMHVGAHTNLEYCEVNYEDAWETNLTSVQTAVRISNQLDIPLVYIGTAGIFDGSKDYYDELDEPQPIGVYAKTKYAAERHVTENAKRHLVCRAGWMMGGGPIKDHKFVGKIMKQLRAGVDEINVVDDKFGSPTYTMDFSEKLKKLLEGEHYGLFNLAGAGSASRCEVAFEILRANELTEQVRVNKVESTYFSGEYFAPRPRSERLTNSALERTGLQTTRNWKDALYEYIDSSYQGFLKSEPNKKR
jgi:dTDP-4-dehydrorhamnose reductase